MRKRVLGKTLLKVSELALGGLFVSSVGGDFPQASETIRHALDAGINYIDTAPAYHNSEDVIGRALEGVDAPVILSTKLGGRPKPFDAQSRDGLLRSVEQSLRLLRRDRIDILMVHEPDRPGQYEWWIDSVDYEGPVWDVLTELKRDGVVSYIGLGGTTAYELPRILSAQSCDVVLTAFNYSLLWREAEIDLLPMAKSLGMGIIVGSPLQQGALARRYDEEIANGAPWMSSPRRSQYRELYSYLDEIEIDLPELALRFVISNEDISCVLTGARSRVELEQNITSVNKGPLPPEILARVNEIAAMVPFRPFEEPFGLPFGRPYKGPGKAR